MHFIIRKSEQIFPIKPDTKYLQKLLWHFRQTLENVNRNPAKHISRFCRILQQNVTAGSSPLLQIFGGYHGNLIRNL